MRRNQNWTAREDSIAALLRARGASPAIIGERLNRSPEAVKRRLRWIKLSAERRAEIGRARTRKRGCPNCGAPA